MSTAVRLILAVRTLGQPVLYVFILANHRVRCLTQRSLEKHWLGAMATTISPCRPIEQLASGFIANDAQ